MAHQRVKDPYAVLAAKVAAAGSQSALARELGVSVPYLNDLIHKRRHFSARMLAKLGLTRVVVADGAPS